MLIEMECDKFESHGKQRGKIVFNRSLNTVVGGTLADNSIGKSTFLLAIDFCFGGNTYNKNNEISNHIGDHEIRFAFEFDREIYYFSRETSNPRTVYVCDCDYKRIDSMKIKEFTTFLSEKYNINELGCSFREIISPFMRIAEKMNYNVKLPLAVYSNNSMQDSLKRLENLFGKYENISNLKRELNTQKAKKTIYQNAIKQKVITNPITSAKELKKYEKDIQQLKEKENELLITMNGSAEEFDYNKAERIAEIKNAIVFRKKQVSHLLSKEQILLSNLSSNYIKPEYKELLKYFPDINIDKLRQVDSYHQKITGILKDEIEDEKLNIKSQIMQLNDEIFRLGQEIVELGEMPNVNMKTLNNYVEIEKKILEFENYKNNYNENLSRNNVILKTNKELDSCETNILNEIQKQINYELKKFNSKLDIKQITAPNLIIKDNNSYSYFTPNDTGTGNNFKGLILFDLVILKLTCLPTFAHDSLLLNNIEYDTLEKIFELYSESAKQIFVAYDKEKAPSTKMQDLVNKSKVISLAKGDELFGRSWSKPISKGKN